MRHFFTGLLTFLVWSVLGIGFYSYYIQNFSDRDTTVTIPPIPKTELVSLEGVLAPYAGKNFTVKELLSIKTQKGTDDIALADSSLQDKLYKLLNEQQTKEVLLTGFSFTGEIDSLGTQRAKALQQLLVDYGLNEDRVAIAAKALEVDLPDGTVDGAVALQLKEMSAERLSAFEAVIANKVLYSGFASNTFKPDNTLQAYALELKGYLNKFPSKNVVITGHTDNVGAEEDNEWIGMQRAKNVMNYLISQGIAEERMLAASKGELEPVAPNTTLEGQRLNRRIEIKAQ